MTPKRATCRACGRELVILTSERPGTFRIEIEHTIPECEAWTASTDASEVLSDDLRAAIESTGRKPRKEPAQ